MQRSNKVALFGAALGVCVLLTSCIPAQADAQQILTAAFTAGNRLPKLADGEFRVVSYTIEKPTNDQSMAKDPYHLADSPLVTETNWIRFDGAIRFERRDAKINALLDMIQITEGKMRSIDGASGVIFDSTLDISSSVSLSQTSNAIPQQFDIRDGRVESIDTGTLEIQAWRITTPADAAILSSLQMELPQMGLRTVQDIWTINRQTNEVISYQQIGIDSVGATHKLFEVHPQPTRTGKLTELAEGWFDIRGDASAATSSNITPPVELKLDTKVAALPGGYFSLSETDRKLAKVLSAMNGLQATSASINFTGADLRTASQFGLSLEQSFELPSDRFMTLIQGPKEPLISLARLRKAVYLESHEVTINLNGIAQKAWVATGSKYGQQPSQLIVMFEIGNSFVYVVGQSLSEDELLAYVSRFQTLGR